MMEEKFTTKKPPKNKIAKAPTRRERITDFSIGSSRNPILVPKRNPANKEKRK